MIFKNLLNFWRFFTKTNQILSKKIDTKGSISNFFAFWLFFKPKMPEFSFFG